MTHCKKTSFANEQYAIDYIEKIHKTSTRLKKPIETYLCDKCLTWHLTSIKRGPMPEFMGKIDKLQRRVDNYERQVVNLKTERDALKEKVVNLRKQVLDEKFRF